MHTQIYHPTRTQRRDGQGWRCLTWRLAVGITLGLTLASPSPGQAKTFHCGAGEVQCLIDAINDANANGHKNTIRLAAGTYTLTAVDNVDIHGANGLPSITSTLTIRGAGAQTAIIERDPRLFFQGPDFRILHVATAGGLTLKGVMIRGGQESLGSGIFNDGGRVSIHTSIITNNWAGSLGGGIYNFRGVVTVTNSTIVGNVVGPGYGGGIENDRGEVTITYSSIADNDAELAGGIDNHYGTVTITNSTIAGNSANAWGGIFNGGPMTILNSTITQNFTFLGDGGAIENYGTVRITNSTIAGNLVDCPGCSGGGIKNVMGTIELHNTILANNTAQFLGEPNPGPDCFGPVTSFGHNLDPRAHLRRNIRLCVTPCPTISCMAIEKRVNIGYLV